VKKYQVCLLVLFIISALGFTFLGARAEGIGDAQEDGPDKIHGCVVPSSGTVIILAEGQSCESRQAALGRQQGDSVEESDSSFVIEFTLPGRGDGDSRAGRAIPSLFAGDGDSGANWQGVNLSTAVVRAGSFRNADFTGANLQGTRFVDGAMEGCNFTDANLQGASFEHWQSMSGSTWSNTICPDGTNSDSNGGTCTGHLTPSL
jgi:hypothetical protein